MRAWLERWIERRLFQYPRGQRVRVAHFPQVCTVRRQRYETREYLCPVVEYLLDGWTTDVWVAEADLRPIEDATHTAARGPQSGTPP